MTLLLKVRRKWFLRDFWPLVSFGIRKSGPQRLVNWKIIRIQEQTIANRCPNVHVLNKLSQVIKIKPGAPLHLDSGLLLAVGPTGSESNVLRTELRTEIAAPLTTIAITIDTLISCG